MYNPHTHKRKSEIGSVWAGKTMRYWNWFVNSNSTAPELWCRRVNSAQTCVIQFYYNGGGLEVYFVQGKRNEQMGSDGKGTSKKNPSQSGHRAVLVLHNQPRILTPHFFFIRLCFFFLNTHQTCCANHRLRSTCSDSIENAGYVKDNNSRYLIFTTSRRQHIRE